jgi:hypothetical protein
VAERSNAAVLKTVDRKVRGFESHPLRQQYPNETGPRAGSLVQRADHPLTPPASRGGRDGNHSGLWTGANPLDSRRETSWTETWIVAAAAVFLVVGVIGVMNPDPTPGETAGVQVPVLALMAIAGGLIVVLALAEVARSVIAGRAKR